MRFLFSLTVWLTAATTGFSAEILPTPGPPEIDASAWLLADAKSGRILAERNADERLPPASLTKIMVSYIVAAELHRGSIALDDMVPVSVKAWSMRGSRMFIREGTEVSLENLLRGVIIQSGNDATVAIAEYVAGSEDAFVQLMNRYATTQLGMTNTRYANATGLPLEGHYTSARDLYHLSVAMIRNFPEHYSIYKERSFTYGTDVRTGEPIMQRNRNELLRIDRSVDGIKTGHTREAGYCLVASAIRGGTRLISIIMGTGSEISRIQETQKLLSYGFRYFETHEIFSANEALSEVPVWGGLRARLSVGVTEPVVLTVSRGQYESLSSKLVYGPAIWAPVAKGDDLGSLRIIKDDEVLYEAPLIALSGVEEAGIFKRTWDWFRYLFSGT